MSPSICQNNCHVMCSALFIIVYTLIVLLLVQSIDSTELNNVVNFQKRPHVEIPLNIAFLQSKRHSLGNFVSNKNDVYKRGLLMENVEKNRFKSDTEQNTVDPTLSQLKQVLSKFLVTKAKIVKKRELSAIEGQKNQEDKIVKRNKDKGKWHKWTNWSTCSVTCGKGREIRWRHCRSNCDGVETEMEEKACQLPSCPRSLFGIIKL